MTMNLDDVRAAVGAGHRSAGQPAKRPGFSAAAPQRWRYDALLGVVPGDAVTAMPFTCERGMPVRPPAIVWSTWSATWAPGE